MNSVCSTAADFDLLGASGLKEQNMSSQIVGYPKIAMKKILRFAFSVLEKKFQTYVPKMVVESEMVMNTMISNP